MAIGDDPREPSLMTRDASIATQHRSTAPGAAAGWALVHFSTSRSGQACTSFDTVAGFKASRSCDPLIRYTENGIVANGFLKPGIQVITEPFNLEALVIKARAMIDGIGGKPRSPDTGVCGTRSFDH
jgi:hypothetical protein